MKISIEWLSELLSNGSRVRDRLSELEERLPLAGLEVKGRHSQGAHISQVRVARVESFEKHPQADRLRVCQVFDGKQTLQIVCGAPNVRQNMIVAMAPVGSLLPNDLKIEKAKIRGVESFGMLCSGKELGLTDSTDGILDLDAGAPVGAPLVDFLGLKGEVWEFELTPDRGDCLSHLGIAREVSRFVGGEILVPKFEVIDTKGKDVALLSVEVHEPQLCPYYSLQLMDGLGDQKTPEDARQRLESLGLRSRSAAVDATNWVLMELGQPLHAFDADEIRGSRINVRFARSGETLVTLDDKTLSLHPEDLVIADAERPLALAGVMGGKSSAVKDSTRRVVLECAVFDPDCVRASAKRHQLHTDSSHRFERRVDAKGVELALGRAVSLIKQWTQGKVKGACVVSVNKKYGLKTEVNPLNLDLRYFRDVTGLDVTSDDLVGPFNSMGLVASAKSKSLIKVDVPSYRHDLLREIDLVEEGARLLGYDKIPTSYPKQLVATKCATSSVADQIRSLKRRSAELGLTQVMPYSFCGPKAEAVLPHAAWVRLENPLSREWSLMRPSLGFGLLETMARHVGLGQPRGAFFDLGSVFEDSTKREEFSADSKARKTGTCEPLHLGWCLLGKRFGEHWSTDKAGTERKEDFDFFDAKGVLEGLLPNLAGIDPRWTSVEFQSFDGVDEARWLNDLSWVPRDLLHPYRSAVLRLPSKSGDYVGYVGELHPGIRADWLNLPTGFQISAVLAEVRIFGDLLRELDSAAAMSSSSDKRKSFSVDGRIRASSLFPMVSRDFSFVVEPGLKASELMKALKKALQGRPINEVKLVDRFVLPDGQCSLSLRLEMQAMDRTLAEGEIAEIQGLVMTTLKDVLKASIRA